MDAEDIWIEQGAYSKNIFNGDVERAFISDFMSAIKPETIDIIRAKKVVGEVREAIKKMQTTEISCVRTAHDMATAIFANFSPKTEVKFDEVFALFNGAHSNMAIAMIQANKERFADQTLMACLGQFKATNRAHSFMDVIENKGGSEVIENITPQHPGKKKDIASNIKIIKHENESHVGQDDRLVSDSDAEAPLHEMEEEMHVDMMGLFAAMSQENGIEEGVIPEGMFGSNWDYSKPAAEIIPETKETIVEMFEGKTIEGKKETENQYKDLHATHDLTPNGNDTDIINNKEELFAKKDMLKGATNPSGRTVYSGEKRRRLNPEKIIGENVLKRVKTSDVSKEADEIIKIMEGYNKEANELGDEEPTQGE